MEKIKKYTILFCLPLTLLQSLPLVSSVAKKRKRTRSPVSQSLSTRQDYSLLSSLQRYRLLRVARACLCSLSPAPCQCPAFASFSTKTPSSAGFKPPSLRPFRNLGNNNAEEKGRESLCRKSVLNSQLHRVQRLRSTTQ